MTLGLCLAPWSKVRAELEDQLAEYLDGRRGDDF